MAVNAANIVFQVRGPRKIAVFLPVAVAIHAALAGGLGGNAFEGEYFRLVAAAFHVFFARPVTGFAALPLGSTLVLERGYKMRRGLKVLEDVFVAGLAGFGADVKGRVGGALVTFR
jgi:hypothetical protein